jgi:hypothetical protein
MLNLIPGGSVTNQENRQRDIDAMRESIRLDWLKHAERPLMSLPEQAALKESIGLLIADLIQLVHEIDGLQAAESRSRRSSMD